MNRLHTQGNNILLVANWESNVGYAWWLMENFWTTIADHFEQDGKRCYLIYPEITQIPESIAASRIQTEKLDFLNRSRKNRGRIRQFIESRNIQYIYLSDYPAYSPFYALLRLWGVKRVIIHDHTPGERTIPSGWRRVVKKLILHMPWITADHFIAVTDFVYRRFIEVSCIPANKCSIVSNGIEPIDLGKVESGYAHREFDIPKTRQIVVTTGRASYYKGIDFIIECLAELVHRRKITDLHFLFCGDGPDLNTFRKQATLLEVHNYITFAGKRSDIRKILPSCDIGLHASRGEVGYSLSILEYMSAGLATIVTDLPSTSEAIQHGKNGLLFRHGDVASACAMLQSCRSSVYRRILSEYAVTSVSDNYNIEQTNRDLIHVLERQFI